VQRGASMQAVSGAQRRRGPPAFREEGGCRMGLPAPPRGVAVLGSARGGSRSAAAGESSLRTDAGQGARLRDGELVARVEEVAAVREELRACAGVRGGVGRRGG